jgi:hypothetical protein
MVCTKWSIKSQPQCSAQKVAFWKRALADSIRDYRPGDLYGDDDARSRWLQLVNVAALALHGDDRDAVKAFIDLCEAPYIN